MSALGEQQELVASERLCGDRRARAQIQEFANLTAELLAGRQGPTVQLDGIRLNVTVEKPKQYDGNKAKDLNTWLFQVREHLELLTVPARGHVPYAVSLLCGNAVLWWREICEANRRPTTWNDFCRELQEQFRPEDYESCGRDDYVTMRQYVRECREFLCSDSARLV